MHCCLAVSPANNFFFFSFFLNFLFLFYFFNSNKNAEVSVFMKSHSSDLKSTVWVLSTFQTLC